MLVSSAKLCAFENVILLVAYVGEKKERKLYFC